MAFDPYATLGIPRDATPEQIRQAYRKLAKRHHPDLNPGNVAAEQRFKETNAANTLLSDPETRQKFDRGEIDSEGHDLPPDPPRYRQHAEATAGERYRPGAEAGQPLDDLFAELFARGGATRGPMRGADAHYALTVEFLDTVNGATRALTLPDGRTLEVRIPPGIESGQVLRLKGQGAPGLHGAAAGDALIEIQVAPHAKFRRTGSDVAIDVPVTLREAVLGARITVPTPTGPVSMTLPPHTENGATLRLRGKGIAAHAMRPVGDLHVTLRLTLADADAALDAFLRQWAPEHPIDPRNEVQGP